MGFKKFFWFLSVGTLFTISPIWASSVKVSQGMAGISTEQCIKAVKIVEGEHFYEQLEIRTHPIVDKKDPLNHIFSGLTIVDYRGDNSHTTITASPNTDGTCDVVYMETFMFPEPCLVAREEQFKKWDFIGKMKDTKIYTFRRDKDRFAYLTDAGLGRFCMITKRKVYLGQ